jgi:BirA family biotin operon repressor/biotin-[acetyl-CoA-carboxylase] ligase
VQDETATRALAATRFTDVRWLDEVDSTNRLLARLLQSGEATTPTVVVADHQTAGRGRRGRTWEAPPSTSLLVSVGLPPPEPNGAQLATAAVALAAADACDSVAELQPALKWPNDLVVGGAKLGGVLAEAVDHATVVVGLGLNVDWSGHSLPAGATSLDRLVVIAPTPAEVLVAFLVALDRLSEYSPSRLVDDYRARCSTLGRDVRVDLGATVLTGRAVAVTDAGHLVVGTASGRKTVAAGDVLHLT